MCTWESSKKKHETFLSAFIDVLFSKTMSKLILLWEMQLYRSQTVHKRPAQFVMHYEFHQSKWPIIPADLCEHWKNYGLLKGFTKVLPPLSLQQTKETKKIIIIEDKSRTCTATFFFHSISCYISQCIMIKHNYTLNTVGKIRRRGVLRKQLQSSGGRRQN